MGTATVRGSLLKVLKSSGVGSLLLAAVSLLLLVYGVLYHNPLLTRRVTYDYFVWVSTLLTLVAIYWEFKRLWDKPLYSTISLLIFGGTFIVVGRVLSIYYNMTFTISYFSGLIGDYYTLKGFANSLLVLVGSLVVLITTALHVILRDVIIVKKGPRICDVFNALLELVRTTNNVLSKYPVLIVLTVGLLAFTLRFIPELYWWPWLIGWDTPEYVAHILDFRERFNPFTSYYWMGSLRNTPPLLPIILAPFSYLVDAWYIFKVYPSITYSILVVLSALLAMELYGRRWWVGLLSGILTTTYVLNLRISWDYHRQLLGSAVVLVTVLVLEGLGEPKSLKQAVVVTLLLVMCGLSMEVTGLVGLTLSLLLLYRGLRSSNVTNLVVGTVGLVVNTLLEIWYWRRPYSFVGVVGVLPPGLVVSYDAPEVLSYLVAGYGLTLPLALIAMSKCRARYTTTATVVLLLAGISPLIAPHSSVITWYRFLIGAAPLISTLAAVGLAKVVRDWRIVTTYLLITSLPGLAFTYGYNWFIIYPTALREFPSMLTPAPADNKLLETLNFFKENNDLIGEAIIIAHPDYARYIHLTIRNPDPSRLIWKSWATNETICRIVESTETKKIILVAVKIPDTNTTIYKCLTSIKPIDEEHPWIQIAQVVK